MSVKVLFTGLLALCKTTDPLNNDRPCIDARYVEHVDSHELRIIVVADPPFVTGAFDQPLLPVYIPGSTTRLGQFITLDNGGTNEIDCFPPCDTVMLDGCDYNKSPLPDLSGLLRPAFRVFNCEFPCEQQQRSGPYQVMKGGRPDGEVKQVVQTFVAVLKAPPLLGGPAILSGPGFEPLALDEGRNWTVYVTCLATYSSYSRYNSVKRSDFPYYYRAFPQVLLVDRYNFEQVKAPGLAPEVPCLPIGLHKYDGPA